MRLFRRRDNKLSRRIERRRLQVRAFLRSYDLELVLGDPTDLPDGPILISTMRNEAVRLPYFFDYYRRLGIDRFLIIDNGSTDETPSILSDRNDVVCWRTDASYRDSGFGVDWVNAVLNRHCDGKWILCVDPDEFLVYPHCDTRGIPALTRWLEQNRRESLAALLIDMYGRGRVTETVYEAGKDPNLVAPWFDAGNYVTERHKRYHNLWIQGGPRQRVIFSEQPEHAPALNKTPLVRWKSGFVFVTSTHNLLPQRLNQNYGRGPAALTSGALLHHKFLHVLDDKVREELVRRQHYLGGMEYQSYADRGLTTELWTEHSTQYQGWSQLCDLGLIAEGGWV